MVMETGSSDNAIRFVKSDGIAWFVFLIKFIRYNWGRTLRSIQYHIYP